MRPILAKRLLGLVRAFPVICAHVRCCIILFVSTAHNATNIQLDLMGDILPVISEGGPHLMD